MLNCYGNLFVVIKRTGTGEVSLLLRSHVACVSKPQSKQKKHQGPYGGCDTPDPLRDRCLGFRLQKTTKVAQVQYIDSIIMVQVARQRQTPTIQNSQHWLTAPQTRQRDRVTEATVVLQRQVPTIQSVQKTVKAPQIQHFEQWQM